MTAIISSSAAHAQRVRELFQRAVAQIRAAHFIDAMSCFDELLHMDASHADALACRGWIHALHGNNLGARRDLQAALRYAPEGWPRRSEVEAQLAIEDEIGREHELAHQPTIAA
jgi:tetratricopeptide (TPR) repeat protein